MKTTMSSRQRSGRTSIRRVLRAALVTALALPLVLLAAPTAQAAASATVNSAPVFTPGEVTEEPPLPPGVQESHITRRYWGEWGKINGTAVRIYWGFDYSAATNHLRGWAWMYAHGDNLSQVHLQAEPLNLGDRNGVLRSAYANSQNGYLRLSTGWVDCHKPNGVYMSNLHYSMRWPDGSLIGPFDTGQFIASASDICT